MSRPIAAIGAVMALLVSGGCGSPMSTTVQPPLKIKVGVEIVYDPVSGSYAGSSISVDPWNATICAPEGDEPPASVCKKPYAVAWDVSFVNPGDQCGASQNECTVVMETKDSSALNGKMYSKKSLSKGANDEGPPNRRVRYNYSQDQRFSYFLRALDVDGKEIFLLDPDIMPHPPGG